MSHELRTPLNAILGFSEVMKTEMFGPHTRAGLQGICRRHPQSGQHLLNLINEILDLSRIEAGRYELNEEPVSLVDIVEDCRHLMQMRARTAASPSRAVRPDLPKLWADERAIRQICSISSPTRSSSRRRAARSGQGRLDRVRRPVSQRQGHRPGHPRGGDPDRAVVVRPGSNSIKTAEQGAGLGLPIVKSLVDLHGGTFTLKSKLRSAPR